MRNDDRNAVRRIRNYYSSHINPGGSNQQLLTWLDSALNDLDSLIQAELETDDDYPDHGPDSDAILDALQP